MKQTGYGSRLNSYSLPFVEVDTIGNRSWMNRGYEIGISKDALAQRDLMAGAELELHLQLIESWAFSAASLNIY